MPRKKESNEVKSDVSEQPKQTGGLSDAAKRAKAFLKKNCKSEFASTLEESKLSNVTDWVSSGSLSFNKILSGSYFKGFANNRVYVLAGPSSTGKSLLCAKTVYQAQQKGYQVFYFDSENAIDNDFMKRFGVDTDALIYFPIKTINEFRNLAIEQMRAWRADPDTKDVKAMFFCDSIGGLMGTKEMNDIEEGKTAADMGQRAKELRACARALTIECAHNMIPLIVTNHTYDQAGANPQMAPTTKMAGGEGFYYASSAVIFLKKRQIKEEKEDALGDNVKVKTGNIIIAEVQKNRFVPEGTKAEIYVDFERGVSPYYGLLQDAVQHGFFEVKPRGFLIKHLDKTLFEKQIYKKEVFGPILTDLNAKVEETYKFSSMLPTDEVGFDDEEGEEAEDSKTAGQIE